MIGGLKMNDHAVPFDASIKRRLAIRELGVKTEYITVMSDASKHVLYDEHGSGTAQ
jgi:hypothetical protein